MLIRGTIPRFFVSPPLHMLGKWNGEGIHDLCIGLAASSVCVVELLLADAYATLLFPPLQHDKARTRVVRNQPAFDLLLRTRRLGDHPPLRSFPCCPITGIMGATVRLVLL